MGEMRERIGRGMGGNLYGCFPLLPLFSDSMANLERKIHTSHLYVAETKRKVKGGKIRRGGPERGGECRVALTIPLRQNTGGEGGGRGRDERNLACGGATRRTNTVASEGQRVRG